jgi:protein arginine kinase
VQVSISSGSRVEFVGACDYLLREERDARSAIGRATLADRARKAVEFAIGSRSIGLADALRVLAWVRWASSAEIEGFPSNPREVDRWLTMLEVRGSSDAEAAARERAAFLRNRVEI